MTDDQPQHPADDIDERIAITSGVAAALDDEHRTLRRFRYARGGRAGAFGIWVAKLYPARLLLLFACGLLVLSVPLWLLAGGPTWEDIATYLTNAGVIALVSVIGLVLVSRRREQVARTCLARYLDAHQTERAAWEELFARFGLQNADDARAVLRVLAVKSDLPFPVRAETLWELAAQHGLADPDPDVAEGGAEGGEGPARFHVVRDNETEQ